jgi:hypothetical protein
MVMWFSLPVSRVVDATILIAMIGTMSAQKAPSSICNIPKTTIHVLRSLNSAAGAVVSPGVTIGLLR